MRAAGATLRFAPPGPGRAGSEESLETLASLEARGPVRLVRTDAQGRVAARAEGSALLLKPASGMRGGWAGEFAGPALLGISEPGALAAGGAPGEKPGKTAAGEALLETPGTLRFELYPEPDPQDASRRLFLWAPEAATVTVPLLDPKSGSPGRARISSASAEARLRWGADGDGRAWIAQKGSVDAKVWDERGRRDGPEWSLTAERADTHLAWPGTSAGDSRAGRVAIERIEAAGPVRFVNHGEGGVEEAWGAGKSLVLEPAGEGGGMQGTLEGPAEFFFLAGGEYPPLEKGKAAPGNLKTARLQGPGPFRFLGAIPEGGKAAPLRVWTDAPASLALEAEEGKEKAPHRVSLEAEALSLEAAPPPAGAGGWDLPEVKCRGATTVREERGKMVVTVLAEGGGGEIQGRWRESEGREPVRGRREEGPSRFRAIVLFFNYSIIQLLN
jgi:hypothetical protein